MNYNIKTGIIISTILILLSMLSLQYKIVGAQTVIDVFIMSAFIVNLSLIYKIFQKQNKTEK
ncbi:hypothetical protein BN863_15950 [Formosa agariphila KMM 3901]|uniref:Uncharacterized protein n=1 Tax=Formosa agariphila (strain DSM 15362 / KCTC 12365 / LMG 23005 / KMM 3901 / M-2Alg 35-1) TaxID=1347342 RepID=T2KKA7_FORAG|nr:hypothetical protein BN863_15950 [Formosa agariphila KMM 3901]